MYFIKEGEKEDTGRGSWASFDIRTAKPDDPVPGLLDKVFASYYLDQTNYQKSMIDIMNDQWMSPIPKVDSEVMDTLNSSKRQERRPESLFSLYPEQDEWDMLERR